MGLCKSQRAIISNIIVIILLLLVAWLISQEGFHLSDYITGLALLITSIIITVFYWGHKPSIDRWFLTRVSEEKLAKERARLEAIEKHKLEQKAKRREELDDKLRAHYHQLVEEVYEKWFDRPSLPIDWGVIPEYSISLAEIIYTDGKITIKELKEPRHQNKWIVEEAIEHLKGYPEVLLLWSDAKEQVKQNLESVEKLWQDLIQSLTEKLSTSCPQLIEWRGLVAIPNDYYRPKITFYYLWSYVQDPREINKFKVTQEGDYFIVNDCARSLNKITMDAFTETIRELATDSAVQTKMNTIAAHKTRIEGNIEKFRESLKMIVDDVKYGDERLKGNCSRCEPWLDELAELGK